MKPGLYSVASVFFIYLLFFIYRVLFWDISEDGNLILLNACFDTLCAFLAFNAGNLIAAKIRLVNSVYTRLIQTGIIGLVILLNIKLLIYLHQLVYIYTGSMDDAFRQTFDKFTFQVFDSYVPVITGYFTLMSAKSYDNYLELKKNKEQVEKNFLLVQNELLKSQIGPHFLFNTMNNIYHMIQDENKDAKNYLMRLSDLLRFQIYEARSDFIDFDEEYKYLMNYVSLQKIRMEHDFNLSIKNRVESEFKIAPLLLINLLENAFKYCGASKTGFIDISFATIQDKLFVFRIENSISDDKIELFNQSGGFGLENLTKRLNLIYKSDYKFETQRSEKRFRAYLQLKIDCYDKVKMFGGR